ncbi:hypothetical protein H6503_03055 [Candidatus Woesearchaeota archaeon]|nr:hypothetical protein [Candidatus Woesearchaeota archaeon]
MNSAEEKNQGCTNLGGLVRAEVEFIKRHVDDHKWFRGIDDQNLGEVDLVENYIFAVKETYCGYGCPVRHNCALAEKYLPKDGQTQ